MNKLLISKLQKNPKDATQFYVNITQAQNILPILRSDHFIDCQIIIDDNLQQKDLKFVMYISRLLATNAIVRIIGKNLEQFKKLFNCLGMIITYEQQAKIQYSKKNIKETINQENNQKLPIGMIKINEQQIDQDTLLSEDNILIKKAKPQNCAQKVRACANCSCGRKDNPNQPQTSKQQLVKNINQGKTVSGCGKCFLGDSFRCGSCPYKGLPAFKLGDKLQLVEQGKIIVEEGGIVINSGKIKIEL